MYSGLDPKEIDFKSSQAWPKTLIKNIIKYVTIEQSSNNASKIRLRHVLTKLVMKIRLRHILTNLVTLKQSSINSSKIRLRHILTKLVAKIKLRHILTKSRDGN